LVTLYLTVDTHSKAPNEYVEVLYGLLLEREAIAHSAYNPDGENGRPWISFEVEAETRGGAVDRAAELVNETIGVMDEERSLWIQAVDCRDLEAASAVYSPS
jgi:hypothetical protein